MLQDATVSYRDAVKGWYDELTEGQYNYATGESDNFGVIGHFTQVVWKGSTYVGCGYNASCNNMFPGYYNTAVVCRYGLPGNWVGEYQKNVVPPCDI
jgi:hypothetical protein